MQFERPLPVLPQIAPFSFGEDEVNFDDTVSVSCTITKGDLPVRIWWTLSDSFESQTEYNISTNDGVVILRSGNKISMLNIEAVKARHRGNYSCYASNKAGIAKQNAYLAINGSKILFFYDLTPTLPTEFCNFRSNSRLYMI